MRSELSLASDLFPQHQTIPDTAGELLDALRDSNRSRTVAAKVAVVVAHPDDESVGIAGQLPRLRDATIVHVTDGAPLDPAFARSAGFSSLDAYRSARQRELDAALDLAGVPHKARIHLGVPDQQVAMQLTETTFRLMRLFARGGFDAVFTHPYEGGHPDHDATAFCVHQACALMREQGLAVPVILEMASYFEGEAGGVYQQFISDRDRAEVRSVLTPAQSAVKRQMLDCHRTQAQYLHVFGDAEERFRIAPAYDFTALPNRGLLHYETFSTGMTGDRWTGLVEGALNGLERLAAAA